MVRKFNLVLIAFLWNSSCTLFAQANKHVDIDTTVYSYKTVLIQDKKHSGFLDQYGFHLVNSKGDTILKLLGGYFTWDFRDINKDGYKDILLDNGGNTPERFDLLLFVPSAKHFKKVLNFNAFPDPKKITGTQYYYSYHKNGCADADWVSDLFYIDHYKAIRIGKIDGVGCGSDKTPTAIYIYRIKSNKKILIKTLAIDTIEKYEETKWGFIKRYWIKNYKRFL